MVLSVGAALVAVVIGTLGLNGTEALMVGAAVVGSGVASVVVRVSSSVVLSMSKPGSYEVEVDSVGRLKSSSSLVKEVRSSEPAEGTVLSPGPAVGLLVTTGRTPGYRGATVV